MAQQSFILQAVKKVYSTSIIVLNDVSVTFEPGMSYAITGVSGSGKTTLLHIMAGIEPPTEGSVKLGNHEVYIMTESKRSQFLRMHIGFVFQSPYFIKELTVLENIMLKGIIAGKHVEKCKDEGYYLLERVGLIKRAHALPSELSGGQQQRVALARALFGKPLFLLTDEPTGNLDNKTGQQIIDLLIYFQKFYNMGLIISSHSPYVIEQMQTIYEVFEGSLVPVVPRNVSKAYQYISR